MIVLPQHLFLEDLVGLSGTLMHQFHASLLECPVTDHCLLFALGPYSLEAMLQTLVVTQFPVSSCTSYYQHGEEQ